MSKAVYITTTEPGSGKSIIVLGLFRMLQGKGAKVGYFRPIIGDLDKSKMDNHIATICANFKFNCKPEGLYAYTRSEVTIKHNQGKSDEILDTIIKKYKAIEAKNDYVIVEGTDFSDENYAFELDANVLTAKNLGIPVIIVGQGDGKSIDETVGSLHMAYDSFREK